MVDGDVKSDDSTSEVGLVLLPDRGREGRPPAGDQHEQQSDAGGNIRPPVLQPEQTQGKQRVGALRGRGHPAHGVAMTHCTLLLAHFHADQRVADAVFRYVV